MTRENRVNLIFLGVLVVLMAPGFALLMYKKLSADAPRSNAMPDPVPWQSAYMQPPPVDPKLPRREPRVVREWVRQQLQAREGPGVAVARDGDGPDAGPLVSDRYVTQLAGLKALADGSLRVTLVRWDERSDLATETPKISADVGGRQVDGTILRTESTEVPKEVRHVLQDTGYVDPPERVWWMTATLPTRAGEVPSVIRVQYRLTSGEPTETIRLAPPATPPTTGVGPS